MSLSAAPAKHSSGGSSWHETHFEGVLLFTVQKLRRVLVTLNMRYFSVYAVNLFFVCKHMNIVVSDFHYNKKLFLKYFFYNINVEYEIDMKRESILAMMICACGI